MKDIMPREIIQWSAVMLARRSRGWAQISEFDRIVRPRFHPVMTAFCVKLTGITQEMIDREGVPVEQAVSDFHTWCKSVVLSDPGAASSSSATARSFSDDCSAIAERMLAVTLGHWDLSEEAPLELGRRRLPVPAYLKRWVNVQDVARRLHRGRWTHSPGLRDLLKHYGLPLAGREHNGLDDCRNTAAIVRCLLREGWSPAPERALDDAHVEGVLTAHAARLGVHMQRRALEERKRAGKGEASGCPDASTIPSIASAASSSSTSAADAAAPTAAAATGGAQNDVVLAKVWAIRRLGSSGGGSSSNLPPAPVQPSGGAASTSLGASAGSATGARAFPGGRIPHLGLHVGHKRSRAAAASWNESATEPVVAARAAARGDLADGDNAEDHFEDVDNGEALLVVEQGGEEDEDSQRTQDVEAEEEEEADEKAVDEEEARQVDRGGARAEAGGLSSRATASSIAPATKRTRLAPSLHVNSAISDDGGAVSGTELNGGQSVCVAARGVTPAVANNEKDVVAGSQKRDRSGPLPEAAGAGHVAAAAARTKDDGSSTRKGSDRREAPMQGPPRPHSTAAAGHPFKLPVASFAASSTSVGESRLDGASLGKTGPASMSTSSRRAASGSSELVLDGSRAGWLGKGGPSGLRALSGSVRHGRRRRKRLPNGLVVEEGSTSEEGDT
jgi:inhibitor of KinA sporulation pathway (predicted exonuclease)